MSSSLLFVYGTLRRGCANPHAQLLERSAQFVGPARVRGKLYRVEWYPGMTLDSDGKDLVVGDLFRVDDPAAMEELDRYEGSNEYQRVTTAALLDIGNEVECWVYEYLGSVTEAARIASGDWMAEGSRGAG